MHREVFVHMLRCSCAAVAIGAAPSRFSRRFPHLCRSEDAFRTQGLPWHPHPGVWVPVGARRPGCASAYMQSRSSPLSSGIFASLGLAWAVYPRYNVLCFPRLWFSALHFGAAMESGESSSTVLQVASVVLSGVASHLLLLHKAASCFHRRSHRLHLSFSISAVCCVVPAPQLQIPRIEIVT